MAFFSKKIRIKRIHQRAYKIIKTFKTFKRIKDADLFELQSLLGAKKGEKIWRELHKKEN